MSPRVREIISQVAEAHGVAVRDILGPTRGMKAVCAARREAMQTVKQLIAADGRPMSFPAVGRVFGRHHTTVIANVRRASVAA